MLDRHKHRDGAVSLEETAVCVVDETGEIMKEFRAASDPEALIKALRPT